MHGKSFFKLSFPSFQLMTAMVSPSPLSPTLGKSLPSFFSVNRKDPSREKASRASGGPKEGNVLWHFPLSHYTNSLPLLRTTSTPSWYCKEKFEKSNWNAEDRFTSHLAFDMGWKLFCIPILRKKKNASLALAYPDGGKSDCLDKTNIKPAEM